jgi:transcriptional regulator with XRE-family HTH domain
MDVRKIHTRSSRRRSRPAGEKKSLPLTKELPVELSKREKWNDTMPEQSPLELEGDAADSSEAISTQTRQPGPFSILLGFLLKNDRSEILRIAREMGVSDNTVYRWLNGTSEPRPGHLQRLLEVLPQSHVSLASFTGASAQQNGRGGAHQLGRWDVQKEIYRRVMELAAITVDDASRRWHIIETIFEYALLHLDPDHQGMALTYARLMPPREDGFIHSLYEAEMRGQAPWPFALDFRAYLGSTTLAGAAAMFQRVQVWSARDEGARIPIGLDENERSSCAAPVMRGGRLAGVLIVSSALDDFMRDSAVPRAIGDYAHLLAAGLMDSDFFPVSRIKLVPMPELNWQRERIARSYLNRVVEYARKQCLSFAEAEQKVLQDLERDFERYASLQKENLHGQESAVVEIEP